MRQSLSTVAALLALGALGLPRPAAAQSPAPPAPADVTDTNRPRAVPGFDPAALDRSIKPCDDF